MVTSRRQLTWLLGSTLLIGCDSSKPHAEISDASLDATTVLDATNVADSTVALPDAANGVEASDGPITGYVDGGPCVPGATRCHDKMGYQECLADGGWGGSHSCAGYSTNGTASYCAVVTPTGGEPWAACVEPACWYWLSRGMISDETSPSATQVGVCTSSTALSQCRLDGTLMPSQECAGICEALGSINGATLGSCAAECSDGAQECLGGPLYRHCEHGRWSTEPLACPDAAPCQPKTSGTLSSIVCGGPCETGTSQCARDLNGVETCIDGAWESQAACTLGRCVQNGPQAECEAECSPGERRCAFDGAATERICGEAGIWEEDAVCPEDEQCRIAGTHSLGCVRCVGSSHTGGNGYAVRDTRCQGNAITGCGPADTWEDPTACVADTSCVEIQQGPSSLAYCAPQ